MDKFKFKNNITIINSANNGNGAAINLALEITTKYAIYLDIDVNLKKTIKKFHIKQVQLINLECLYLIMET